MSDSGSAAVDRHLRYEGEVAVIRGADEVLGPTPSLAPRMEHAAPDDRDTRRPVRPRVARRRSMVARRDRYEEK
jgi:hypothetical protein